MTTPPQGPWGSDPSRQQPGQGGQQPGQGGWGQPQQGGQQGGQPWGQGQQGQQPWGQPGQGQQGQQPWGQPGQHGQQGQQGQGGWGRPQQGQQSGGYSQQPWGQQGQGQGQGQHQQQGGWGQQQQWQPPQGGGGGNKNLFIIGGAVAGVLVLALLVFLGVRALGGDDDNTADPEPGTSQTTQPTGDPTGSPTGDPTGSPTDQPTAPQTPEVGNSTGQAKQVTDALSAGGYECSDLFNSPQGGHRGCFKNVQTSQGEALFQFTPDGNVTGLQIRAYDTENVNNAKKSFTEIVNAIGKAAFSGDIQKINDAVNNGQKSVELTSDWGRFRLTNSGDNLRLSGGKTGTDTLEVPRKTFDSTEADFENTLKTKGYTCTSYCKKGGYPSKDASRYVSGFGSGNSGGLRSITASVSGDAGAAKTGFDSTVTDVFGSLKGADVPAIQAWVKSKMDGKAHSGYVNGWRVDVEYSGGDSYQRLELQIKTELFYV